MFVKIISLHHKLIFNTQFFGGLFFGGQGMFFVWQATSLACRNSLRKLQTPSAVTIRSLPKLRTSKCLNLKGRNFGMGFGDANRLP
jgi:hypothetical protein